MECGSLFPMHSINNNRYERQISLNSTTPSIHSSTASTALYEEDEENMIKTCSSIMV